MFTIVDAARRPEEQFTAAGQSKTLWIILGVVGIFCFGLIIGIVYLAAIRPKLERVGGGYGGPSYGGGYPPSGPPSGGNYPPPPGTGYQPPPGGGYGPPPGGDAPPPPSPG